MAGNTFGNIFKISTFGESHGPAIGVVIDGVPPNISLDESDIQYQEEKVNIECSGTFTRGVSFCEEHRMFERDVPDPNVLVAVNLDYQRFTDRFMTAVFDS